MAYGLVFGHGYNGQYIDGLSIQDEFIYLSGGLVRNRNEPVGNQFNFSAMNLPFDGGEIIVAYVGNPPSEEEILRAFEDAREAYPHHFY